MKTKTKHPIRELRKIIGQTQAEFAAMVGASKDAVASWETNRNKLSPQFARRIAFATGVEAESLLREGVPLTCRGYAGRREPFSWEAYQKHAHERLGRSDEATAKKHARYCKDALELLLVAAAKAGECQARGRLPAVVQSFIEWCESTREDFQLDKAIDEQLSQRKWKLEFTHSYGQWRRMQLEDPTNARVMGFKDNPKKPDNESLTLATVVIPVWMPGYSMRGKEA